MIQNNFSNPAEVQTETLQCNISRDKCADLTQAAEKLISSEMKKTPVDHFQGSDYYTSQPEREKRADQLQEDQQKDLIRPDVLFLWSMMNNQHQISGICLFNVASAKWEE